MHGVEGPKTVVVSRAMATKAQTAKLVDTRSAEALLAKFIDKYSKEVAELFRECRVKMQELVPGAVELVYDNYNALVIGFGPSEHASEAPLSIAAYPRWVNLYFLDGIGLPDPKRILKGSGKMVRNLTVRDAAELDRPEVKALIKEALKRTIPQIDAKAKRRLVIRAVSAKQRPRR